MLLPRLARALRPLTTSSAVSPLTTLKVSLLSALPTLHQQTRQASHATSGRANKGKDGPGKRLGAKKTAGPHPTLRRAHTQDADCPPQARKSESA